MPKQVDKIAIKQHLLKEALMLFAKKGYAGLSMRQLASALNITTGTLYHYFKNKDALYTQMLHLLANQDAQALLEKLSPAQNQSELIMAFIDFLEERHDYFYHVLLLLFDHHRLIADTGFNANQEFVSVFQAPLDIYQQTLIDVLNLPSVEEAKTLLNYLIGCFTRAMVYQNKPEFNSLPKLLASLIEERKPEQCYGISP